MPSDSTTLLLLFLLFLRIYLPYLIAKAAERRGRSKWRWFIAGLVIGPLWLFVAYIVFGQSTPHRYAEWRQGRTW